MIDNLILSQFNKVLKDLKTIVGNAKLNIGNKQG